MILKSKNIVDYRKKVKFTSCKILLNFFIFKVEESKDGALEMFYNDDNCFWNTFLRASILVWVNSLIYIVFIRFDCYINVYFYRDSHQDIQKSLVLTKKYVLKLLILNFDKQKCQKILRTSTRYLFFWTGKSLKNKKLIDTYL